MKITFFSALIATCLTFMCAATAHALPTQTSYIQVGASDTTISGFNYGGLTLTAGRTFTQHFGLEIDGSAGVTNRKLYGVSTKIDYTAGAFAVASAPLLNDVDVIVRIGAAQTRVKATYNGDKATETGSGPAIGVGVRYFPNGGQNGVRADVTHYDFGSHGRGQIYQISYIRAF